MNFSKISMYLSIDEIDIFYKIKKIETDIYKLLIETDSGQMLSEIRFIKKDIKVITAIAENCRNNINLMENDSLLEIIILYYCIMEIIYDKHTMETLENYFQINNFTNILIANIGYFSKPYFKSINNLK